MNEDEYLREAILAARDVQNFLWGEANEQMVALNNAFEDACKEKNK